MSAPRRLAATVGVAAVMTLTGCSVPGIATYVPPGGENSNAAGPGTFSPAEYVQTNWDNKILPTVDKDAVDAATLLKDLAADQAGASKKYGNQAGTGSPYAFLIKGTGTIQSVDAQSPLKPAVIQIDGVPTSISTQVITGNVIAGTALRDALKFIDFSQFKNQLDYAAVATELNNRVKKDVIAPLEGKTLVGKKYAIQGAFSLIAPTSILIVPTSMKEAP